MTCATMALSPRAADAFPVIWAPAATPFDMDSAAVAADNAVMDAQDREDVRACLARDPEAYERIVRRHQESVAARMRRFTRDDGELEELVQEVFVEAYFSLPGFRHDAPLSHWLNRIATRTGRRFWQKQIRRRKTAPLAIEDWDAAVQACDTPERAAELVHGLLARLPPRDRLVLTLMYIEERSVAETAALTGWSKTMVKVQAHRARNKLKALLERSPDASRAMSRRITDG